MQTRHVKEKAVVVNDVYWNLGSSDSLYSDMCSDNGDLANWEQYVADNGNLFYAEYIPQDNETNKYEELGKQLSLPITENKANRRKYNHKRSQSDYVQNQKHKNINDQISTKIQNHCFKFSDIKCQGHVKQLELIISAANRYRFGRRSSAVESILGFRVVAFPDQPECLMVDDFIHQMPNIQQHIIRGDWFKSLDNIDIRTSNIEELLLQFTEPTKVCLRFQGAPPIVDDITDLGNIGQNIKIIEDFSTFAKKFSSLTKEESKTTIIAKNNDAQPFIFLLLPPECYQNDKYKSSLYSYPENPEENFLYKTRGSFLTMNAVLTEELKTKPLVTKILIERDQYYVNYGSLGGFLALSAFLAEKISVSESKKWANELLCYIRFALPNLSPDDFLKSNVSVANLRRFLNDFFLIQQNRFLAICKRNSYLFEELFEQTRYLPLPKEAQLRILDAMSELEAMDYRNWNTEPLNTHREFFVYGSALFYDMFILVSQVPVNILSNIECFLRCRGIFNFIVNQNVKELYVWEEIILPNTPERHFLIVCGRHHFILTVILKLFNDPDLVPNAKISPSLFYIEEIQETLEHLIQCGIESLAMFWSVSNKRPAILCEVGQEEYEKNSMKSEISTKQKLPLNLLTSSNQSQLEEESYVSSSVAGSSVQSEEEVYRKRLVSVNSGFDSDSESDWENFYEQDVLDSESQCQIAKSLRKEINNLIPVNITAGWKNELFYYISIDHGNGLILCPFLSNVDVRLVTEIRKACFLIHNVLKSSNNIKLPLTKEVNKNITGMVAIKEHSISVQLNDTSNQLNMKNNRFIVVGRLFKTPIKEIYVCHRPDVPQNIIEIAFRLSLFSVG
ncbi:protein inturned [Teleopsis dalmanni]|uniref:protein inturned n=1 Tax=Teleopsis dalmanni TaxID=139649 RepID=UPI0018CF1CC6|nr:protein inturned [Teleopsis dalmanni]